MPVIWSQLQNNPYLLSVNFSVRRLWMSSVRTLMAYKQKELWCSLSKNQCKYRYFWSDFMKIKELLIKGFTSEFPLHRRSGAFMEGATPDLMTVANSLIQVGTQQRCHLDHRQEFNTTNVCVANCSFAILSSSRSCWSYITSIEEYRAKIEEMIEFGGEQLLFAGGHHPGLVLTHNFQGIKSLLSQAKTACVCVYLRR